MFERFTEKAINVVSESQRFAKELKSGKTADFPRPFPPRDALCYSFRVSFGSFRC